MFERIVSIIVRILLWFIELPRRIRITAYYLWIVLRNVHSPKFCKNWLAAAVSIEKDLKEPKQLLSLDLPKVISPVESEPVPGRWVSVSPGSGPGLMSLVEQATMASIANNWKPRAIFEIGTYLGASSLLLAANSPPDAKVYTLDLPQNKDGQTPMTRFPLTAKVIQVGSPRVGELLKDSEYSNKVTQLFGDSATYDFSAYFGQMDLVFIDGNHQYDNVKVDSDNAFKLLKPKGVILWHDYEIEYGADVVRYLNELGRSVPLRWISGTRLVIYTKGA